MKRNDYLLAGVICLTAIVLWVFQIVNRDSGTTVVVKTDGHIYGTYRLDCNREILIDDHNLLVIKEGKAYMKWADCKDQLCVHQKEIASENESIICLPNKVIVEVSGRADTQPETDATAQ